MAFLFFPSLLAYMIVCSFTPGPGNILALNVTSTYGWKKSRPLIYGICLGYLVVQILCSITIYMLDHIFSSVMYWLQFVGGIYMIWLAGHIIFSKPENNDIKRVPRLWDGLLLQLVNVKIYFYIATLLSVYFIPNCESFLEIAIASCFAVGIGSVACFSWAFLGIKIQKVYFKYFKPINMILGMFLLYCAWTIMKG